MASDRSRHDRSARRKLNSDRDTAEKREPQIVNQKRLRDYAGKHPEAQAALDEFERIIRAAKLRTPVDLKQTFNSVDPVKVVSGRTLYVFNIGRAHRLIAAIDFKTAILDVLRIMTHAEYDRDRWKEQL